ncbi:hypothetical protein ACIGKR_12060 [Rhodococcus qingshengii]|uniref:hypothetical protein n=1 Tax=Rhodococcus qingshengii TaxID=334542 RepID=UPI0037C6565B
MSVRPAGGVLTTPDLDPGPARVCIAFEWFDIVIPDASGSQRLWPLIKDSVPYEPPVVSLVKQYRDEMVSTKAAVETSLEHYGGVLTGLAERAEAAADRAEEAEGGGGSGVPSGGWPLSSLAQEVIDEFGGGVTLPIGLGDLSDGVKASLAKADSSVQGDDARLTNARTPTAHEHTIANVEYLSDALDSKAPKNNPTFTGTVTTPTVKVTTGAGTGKVLTSNADGVATWETPAAGGGSNPAIALTGPTVGSPAGAASADSHSSVVIGNGAKATGFQSTIVGNSAGYNGTAERSTAFGHQARAAYYGTSIGPNAWAQHSESTALGASSSTTKANQVMLGRATETVTMPGKAEIGTGTAMVTLSTRITGGKAELVAQFATGSPIVIATQP